MPIAISIVTTSIIECPTLANLFKYRACNTTYAILRYYTTTIVVITKEEEVIFIEEYYYKKEEDFYLYKHFSIPNNLPK